MARTRKKNKNKNKSNEEILGIILLTSGILLLLSIFSKSLGSLGKVMNNLLFSVMGFGTYFFPILIIYCAITKIVNKNINYRKFYSVIIFFINTVLFIQMINIYEFYSDGLAEGLKKILSSTGVFHGGVIGFMLSVPLYKLLGRMGSLIVFIAIYIICVITIFDISLYELGSNYINKINNDTSKNKKQKKNTVEEPKLLNSSIKNTDTDDSSSREEFIKGINNKIKVLDFMKSSVDEENQNPSEEPKVNIDSYEYKETKNSKLDNDVKESVSREILSSIEEKNLKSRSEYLTPSNELLNQNSSLKLNKDDKKDLLNSANKLEETLGSFGVEAKILQVTKGPSVTRYELQPSAGVKVSKIVNLSDDIALSLAASGVRIEAPIPGKSAIGIEVPNRDLSAVFIREVIDSDEFKNFSRNLAFCLGKDIGGNCVVADLTKMPHLLIAGATGSGKSVCINTLIISLLYKYSPDEVKLLMVDPKVVELNVYNGIPHLLIPVVTDPKKAAAALNWAVNEMTRRYKLFAENGVRNIESFNELFNKNKIKEKLPWIVIIVDELADLMMVCPHDVEDYIGRLAQMARAAGMHLVIATQRPSVDVITGVIKANIPSRISFAVSSQIDSRTILDSAGAEKLLGKGDMLFYPVGESKPLRIQGAFISEEEVEKVVDFIKRQHSNQPDRENEGYTIDILKHIDDESVDKNDLDEDELLEEAIKIVVESGQASTSLLQRKLRIGYNRAARIMEQLEEKRIISPRDGSKPRQVLFSKEDID